MLPSTAKPPSFLRRLPLIFREHHKKFIQHGVPLRTLRLTLHTVQQDFPSWNMPAKSLSTTVGTNVVQLGQSVTCHVRQISLPWGGFLLCGAALPDFLSCKS